MLSRSRRHSWRPTNAPYSSARTEDIWFADEKTGWLINSNGQVFRTLDGGDSWTKQLQAPHYLRCIGFAGHEVGWVGTSTPEAPLLWTRDGGRTWKEARNLPQGSPAMISGLWAVDENVVYAAGTHYPGLQPSILKSANGGETWTLRDMSEHATILTDISFIDAREGWAVGGRRQGELVPAVLHTTDGGSHWTDVLASSAPPARAHGEWARKIQRLDDTTFFASLESSDEAAILRSSNGGRTWQRLSIDGLRGETNLEGIGFIDQRCGWVGGWGELCFQGAFVSHTCDGGQSWGRAGNVGFRINRFRFLGSPAIVGYASGDTVYKMSEQSPSPTAFVDHTLEGVRKALEARDSVKLEIVIPAGARRLRIDVWERLGRHLITLVDRAMPRAGAQNVVWNFRDSGGASVPEGAYIMRLTVDDEAESRLVYRTS